MSRKHDGISCDFCNKSGFSLRRYKCLICYDFDLCGSCFDSKRELNNHRSDHPMQCLLTKYDYGTFYAGEIHTDLAFSYTCPLCGQLGHTIPTLSKHISSEHSDSNKEVICPICVSVSDGNANQQTRNLNYHISAKHSQYLTGDSQDGSPKSSRKSLKHSRNIADQSLAQTNTNKNKKTILPNTVASESYSTQSSSMSNATIFSNHEQGSFGSTDEPLLHTLLNHLYTWRTRREHLSFGKNQSMLENRGLQENPDTGLQDESNEASVNATRDTGSNQMGILPPRNTLKSLLQERNKSLRRKHGSRHIIDLTGENWRLVDPDSDMFSFDDEDLENISLSLNQTSMQPNEVNDSEYLDDDDDDIASLFPWGQDIAPESIFNQLKNIVNPKSNTLSSNNSFVRSNTANTSSNNFYTPNNLIGTTNSTLEVPDFRLPVNQDEPTTSCELSSDNNNPNSNRQLVANTVDFVGHQGLLARDIQKSLSQQNNVNQIPTSNRSQFIRDILLSTFVEEVNRDNIKPDNDKFNSDLD